MADAEKLLIFAELALWYITGGVTATVAESSKQPAGLSSKSYTDLFDDDAERECDPPLWGCVDMTAPEQPTPPPAAAADAVPEALKEGTLVWNGLRPKEECEPWDGSSFECFPIDGGLLD